MEVVEVCGKLSRFSCPIKGCGQRPRNLCTHLIHFHDTFLSDAGVYTKCIKNLGKYCELKFMQCPETRCKKTMLEEVYMPHLRNMHHYSISQAAVMLHARSAAPMPQPLIEVDTGSGDEVMVLDSDHDDVCIEIIEDMEVEVEVVDIDQDEPPQLESAVALDSSLECLGSSAVAVDSPAVPFESPGAPFTPRHFPNPMASKSGVRFEKRLTPKDCKRLCAGELTFDEYKRQKLESDRRREEMDKREAQIGHYNIRDIARESISGEDPEAPSSSNRKPAKKEEPRSGEVYRCRMCLSYRLRVVDYGRTDGMNILECANRKCLASISLTDKPAGTMIEAPKNSAFNCGWMMDSTLKRAYPSLEKIASGELTANPKICPSAEEDYGGEIKFLRCPGQTARARIM